MKVIMVKAVLGGVAKKTSLWLATRKVSIHTLGNEGVDPYAMDRTMSLFMRFWKEGVWTEKPLMIHTLWIGVWIKCSHASKILGHTQNNSKGSNSSISKVTRMQYSRNQDELALQSLVCGVGALHEGCPVWFSSCFPASFHSSNNRPYCFTSTAILIGVQSTRLRVAVVRIIRIVIYLYTRDRYAHSLTTPCT